MVLLFGLVAFAPALLSGFVFDDRVLLEGVPSIATPSFEGFRALWTEDARSLTAVETSVPYYRPVTFSSFLFDRLWGGGAKLAFHLTNLSLFAGTLVLLLRFFERLFASRRLALLATLAFALHPARVETVVWISGRPDLLVLLGALLAAEVAARRDGSLLGRSAVFLLGGVLALGAKELGVVLPLFVFAASRGKTLGERLRSGSLLAAGLLVVSYLALRAVAFPLPEPGRLYGGVAARLGLVFETLGRNASALTFPVDLSLLAATQRTVEGRDVFSPAYVGVGAAFLGVVLVVAFSLRRRGRVLEAAILFLLASLPTANLWPMPALVATTPRFVFVPAVFFLFFVFEVGRNVAPLPLRRLGLARWRELTLGGASVLALGTFVRSLDFVSEAAFFRAEARTASRVPMVVEFLASADLRAGDLARAVVRTECGLEALRREYPRAGSEGALLGPLLGPVSVALADGEREGLLTWAAFLRGLGEGRSTRAVTPLSLTVRDGAPLLRELVPRRVLLAALEADVLLRAGRAPEALERVATFEARCRNADEGLALARVAARAGDLGTVDRLRTRFPILGQDERLAHLVEGARLSDEEDAAGVVDSGRRALLRAHRAGLAGVVLHEALRLWGREFEFSAPDRALAEIALFAANFAGEVPARDALARRLGAPISPRPLPLAPSRLVELRASLVDGCRFRDE